MKKLIATITLAIVCTAALFADAIIAQNSDTIIIQMSEEKRVPDLEIPGKIWTYYERFRLDDPELMDQYLSRMADYAIGMDSETLDMRVQIDGSEVLYVMTTDMELVDKMVE